MKSLIFFCVITFGVNLALAAWKDDVLETVVRLPHPGDYKKKYSPTRAAMHRTKKFSR